MDQETSESYNYLNPIIGDGAPAGALTRGNGRVKSYTFNQLLNYTKNIEMHHNFEAMAGHENYDSETVGSSVSVRGQIAPGKNLELGNFSTVSEAPVSSTVDKTC